MNKITIKQAAALMGKSQQSIRLGLQQKTLPIGSAIKTSKNRWTYYISPKLFSDFTGINIKDFDLERTKR